MKESRIRRNVLIAVMAAVICILGPLSIPIGPVPVTLTNFAIYITMYVLGTRDGAIAYLLYMLIGLAGLPVFSGFTGGPAKLLGPTGGYLIGFLPMALIAGAVIVKAGRKPVLSVIGMFAATWVPYLLGTAWLAYSAHMTFGAAFGVGVAPFLVEDFCKMVAAAVVGPLLYSALSSAGLLQVSAQRR
ncbi:biotin transporter BioY [Clostridium vitabionis]|jgi:biotin transport system substrate-specific component|uniref:biotin transporter BioY n=1 Tax=Clostridium vitabionis TaxID=2784388 RepID=UPI00188B2692|nr:biotin transporter BioY [Clostridium vitabionis]